ncbi:dihydrodipicolinate synthase family protein [Streptomyces ficellus]|uniref:Dihydrodipicolinate synthase family protein n=1 Tax=Streptomyces ficellus TaxID=1977088 RepID=A0A6I6FLG2_9ACTN|nr:hypothetical protein EIZ62_31965 [Streptomyces ficellus]
MSGRRTAGARPRGEANICTADYAELIALWHGGAAGPARRLGAVLARLSAVLFAEPNPAVIKAVLYARGRIPAPAVRLPLLAASGDVVRRALEVVRAPVHRGQEGALM